MPRTLLLSVRFHDGRYHGRPEWPPSPARLFQALVACAAKGGSLPAEDRDALTFLEQLPPPIIAAPVARFGRGFINYVPNNDLDAVGGDPSRVADIRAAKLIKPVLFDAAVGLLYAWTFEAGEAHARKLCAMAEKLYQLGRGDDMAWGGGEIVDASEVEARLAAHDGVVYRPGGGNGVVLACPEKGSLASLERRFVSIGKQFKTVRASRRAEQIYLQAPKARFASVAYNGPPQRLLFDLSKLNDKLDLGLWPHAGIVAFAEHIRDLAAGALKERRPEAAAAVERVFIGRDANQADKASRIRIVPLPSIGSRHVVPAIRRMLVEVPPNCPFARDDIEAAFSGLKVSEQPDPETGEVIEARLLPADDRTMLGFYGIGANRGYRVWRTVTPVALPESAARRRIDPLRLGQELAGARSAASPALQEAKPAGERLDEERRAGSAVATAVRHAGMAAARFESIRVQREPFAAHGARAEEFAPGTRFAKERLWHVEIIFAEPMTGPLVIGDGRYLGLGLMAPDRDDFLDVVEFRVPAKEGIAAADGPALVHAARRALMALAQETLGEVPRLFSGHESGGGRAASGRHEHIFLAADDTDGDGRIDRLVVAAPWLCDRTISRPHHAERRNFDAVVSKLENVRAGRLGIVTLGRSTALVSHDALVGPGRVWESRTPYLATRHAGRRRDAKEALARDIAAECERRGFPRPREVEILEFKGMPNGGGLSARARLCFGTAIQGPILIGRDSHRGGGMFGVAD